MKTTIIYSLIFSCFFIFSACSNDDDSSTDNSEVQAKLQGKWLYEGLTINGAFEEPAVEEGNVYYDFKAGGVLVVTEGAGSINGTYLVTGSDLTLRIDGEVVTFKIMKLTTNVLELFGNIDANEDPGLDQVTFHLSKN